MRITFHPAARRELREAHDRYEGEREGLGDDFLAKVGEATDLLADYPKSAPEVAPQVRRRMVDRFPYSIIYTLLDKNHLSILAVAHHRRRPFYWIGRLGG